MNNKELVSLKTLHLESEKTTNETLNAFSIFNDDEDVAGWGEIFWTATPENSSKVQNSVERSVEVPKFRSKTPILLSIEKHTHRVKSNFSNLRELRPKVAVIPKIPGIMSNKLTESLGISVKAMIKAHQRAKLVDYKKPTIKRNNFIEDSLKKIIKIHSILPVKIKRKRNKSIEKLANYLM
ncbi:hypothetical protein SteCoe_27596 [Stentor coeruleus]|uniref:Uncharacterized protein n=1 Tax=Stentor coeruleus TaxID=5963 RepID=A0A1R2BA61_9CILI|nr:hypothetical protein SteCoe_27596 [Stentor coeruleus]